MSKAKEIAHTFQNGHRSKSECLEMAENYLLNYSNVSRLLTNDRTAIRGDYKGKKYKRKIDRLKLLVKLWIKWQETF